MTSFDFLKAIAILSFLISLKKKLKIFILLRISKIVTISKKSFSNKLFIFLYYNLRKKGLKTLFLRNTDILAIYWNLVGNL